ncbi:MAG TPA: hypothetical protein VJJ82_04755 [Candidatus Nanoarchaeia archaeon]|nr:hypothetical protein [Candidatus Nanoarchaeia archaeon]
MGELESLLVYDQQSAWPEPDFSIVAAALGQLREPQENQDIEKEVKAAFEKLRESDDEAKFDDVKPLIEQELDPSSYENNGYSLEVEYGNKKVEIQYESYNAKQEVNGASHSYKAEAQAIADAARDAGEKNRTYIEGTVDAKTKAVVFEQKSISLAQWWAMYNGKIKFN